MTEEPEKRECDPEDIVCQMQVLSHLKGLKNVLGNEKFRSNYPELENLDERLVERIKDQEAKLRESMTSCGLPILTGNELVEGIDEEE